MKEFVAEDGSTWTAAVIERPGPNYKGRCVLQMTAAEGGESVTLDDVAWNSAYTARRTLSTMSMTELRRRLRAGLGRTSTARMP